MASIVLFSMNGVSSIMIPSELSRSGGSYFSAKPLANRLFIWYQFLLLLCFLLASFFRSFLPSLLPSLLPCFLLDSHSEFSRGLLLGGVLGVGQMLALPVICIFSSLPSVQTAARAPTVVASLLQFINGKNSSDLHM